MAAQSPRSVFPLKLRELCQAVDTPVFLFRASSVVPIIPSKQLIEAVRFLPVSRNKARWRVQRRICPPKTRRNGLAGPGK